VGLTRRGVIDLDIQLKKFSARDPTTPIATRNGIPTKRRGGGVNALDISREKLFLKDSSPMCTSPQAILDLAEFLS
jgi:hypothetical protein